MLKRLLAAIVWAALPGLAVLAPSASAARARAPRITVIYVSAPTRSDPMITVNAFAAGFSRRPGAWVAYGRTRADELVLERPGRKVGPGVWWFSWRLSALTTGDLAHGGSGGDLALGGERFPGALVRRYAIAVRAEPFCGFHCISSGPYTNVGVRHGVFRIH
jgi:hypothetical protein